MKILAFLSLTSVVLAAGCSGCAPTPAPPTGNAKKAYIAPLESEKLLAWAVQNLSRIENFYASDERNQILDRMNSIRIKSMLPAEVQGNLLLASWPKPGALQDIVGKLNQWAENQDAPSGWKSDPLLADLPASLAEIPMLQDLDKLRFTAYDGFALMETVWLRDASGWARGKSFDELDEARQLFDWTTRNIQLDQDAPDHVPQVPWETLLFGRGTAMERAWVYILLLRQQGIDAAILAVPVGTKSPADLTAKISSDENSPTSDHRLRPWSVAVLIGQKADAKLYLFDTALGLPIPAPGPIKLGSDGQLDVRPATLDEIAANPHIMDRLDSEQPYWVKSADPKQFVVLVEASPIYLSLRSKLLESHLVGQDKMVLTTDASAQAERLKATAHVSQARLWNLPYITLHDRLRMGLPELMHQLDEFLPFYGAEGTPLFKGRVLQTKGRFFDSEGAIQFYQAARPPTEEMTSAMPERTVFYYKNIFLPQLAQAPAEQQEALKEVFKGESIRAARMEIESILRGRADASYWLGIISYEQGNFASALDYLQKRTLEARPDGPWTSGAHYNIGRSLEAMGETSRAIEEYKASVFSPLDIGNLLRARWLSEAIADKKPKKNDAEPAKK